MIGHPPIRRVILALVALWSTLVASCSDGEEDAGLVASSSTVPVDSATTVAPLATSPLPASSAEGGAGPLSLQDSARDRLSAAGFAPSEASCLSAALFAELAGAELTAALEALAPEGPDGAALPADEGDLGPAAAELLRACRE